MNPENHPAEGYAHFLSQKRNTARLTASFGPIGAVAGALVAGPIGAAIGGGIFAAAGAYIGAQQDEQAHKRDGHGVVRNHAGSG